MATVEPIQNGTSDNASQPLASGSASAAEPPSSTTTTTTTTTTTAAAAATESTALDEANASTEEPESEAAPASEGAAAAATTSTATTPPEKRWPGWPGHCVFRLIVPVLKVGSIIGRKGELIKKTCEETRARIRVLDGAVGTPDRIVSLYLHIHLF